MLELNFVLPSNHFPTQWHIILVPKILLRFTQVNFVTVQTNILQQSTQYTLTVFKKAEKGEKVTKEDVLKWNVIPSKVVKPVVETDISRAANSFAKDSTNIKYRYRYKKHQHQVQVYKIQKASTISTGGDREEKYWHSAEIYKFTRCTDFQLEEREGHFQRKSHRDFRRKGKLFNALSLKIINTSGSIGCILVFLRLIHTTAQNRHRHWHW